LLKRGFVPRPGGLRARGVPLGWETSLVQPWGLYWGLTWKGWTSLEGATRVSLIRTTRKLTKKLGTTTVMVHPGAPVTARPVGTRMGKGKGKVWTSRGWLTRGAQLLHLRGGWLPGWGVLSKRTPRGVAQVLPRGW